MTFRVVSFAAQLAAVATLSAISPALAQDAAEVGPDAYRCTFRNDRVRACEVSLPPGASVGMHSHPEHLAYVMTGGRLVITTPDGKSSDWIAKPGAIMWAPAERHALRNPGDVEVRALIVEFLAPPPTPSLSPRGKVPQR